jgi:hypothetical protein
MVSRPLLSLLCIVAASGCARDQWPDPPRVDEAQSRQEHAELTKQQQETAAYALSLLGVWPLEEGDTRFGADPALPIVIAGSGAATRSRSYSSAECS